MVRRLETKNENDDVLNLINVSFWASSSWLGPQFRNKENKLFAINIYLAAYDPGCVDLSIKPNSLKGEPKPQVEKKLRNVILIAQYLTHFFVFNLIITSWFII